MGLWHEDRFPSLLQQTSTLFLCVFTVKVCMKTVFVVQSLIAVRKHDVELNWLLTGILGFLKNVFKKSTAKMGIRTNGIFCQNYLQFETKWDPSLSRRYCTEHNHMNFCRNETGFKC